MPSHRHPLMGISLYRPPWGAWQGLGLTCGWGPWAPAQRPLRPGHLGGGLAVTVSLTTARGSENRPPQTKGPGQLLLSCTHGNPTSWKLQEALRGRALETVVGGQRGCPASGRCGWAGSQLARLGLIFFPCRFCFYQCFRQKNKPNSERSTRPAWPRGGGCGHAGIWSFGHPRPHVGRGRPPPCLGSVSRQPSHHGHSPGLIPGSPSSPG